VDNPRFCPQCGGTLKVQQTGDRERPVCQACGFVYYLNPTVAAGTLVEQNGRIVLVRRKVAPAVGFWGLPAGYVEADESAEDAAIRETLEETGLHVALDELLDVYSYSDQFQRRGVLILYSAHLLGGILQAGDDAMDAAFFAPEELPHDDQIAFRTHAQALHDWRRARAVAYGPASPKQAERAASILRSHGERQRDFEVDICSDNSLLLAATDDGVLVAFASLTTGKRGEAALLNHVFVLPRYRRWGIGSELIRRCIVEAGSREASTILAEVEATNPAIVVYIKMGFRVSGFLNGPAPGWSGQEAVLFLSHDLQA